jgi:hypothetical protein
MPILHPRSKLRSIETQSDPGLEYLESQRTWEHRSAPDKSRVACFFLDAAAHPQRYPKSKRFKLADRIQLTPKFERLETSFLKTLATRKTGRDLGSRHADLDDISTLFMAAFGEQRYLPGSVVDADRRPKDSRVAFIIFSQKTPF